MKDGGEPKVPTSLSHPAVDGADSFPEWGGADAVYRRRIVRGTFQSLPAMKLRMPIIHSLH
jgi:hypothetical protein